MITGCDGMLLGKRDLRRDDWNRLLEKKVIIEDVENEYMNGKVCFLHMIKVSSPLIVNSPIGNIMIANDGFKHLMFAPRNQNWWLTVMFDNENHLIESYFDITKENNFSNESNPYFIDMKLDVCIPNKDKPYIMDDNELKEVFDSGLITKEEYNLAYSTAKKIMDFFIKNEDEYYQFIWHYYNKFNK